MLVGKTLATQIHAGKTATPITIKTFFENVEPIDANMTVPQYLGRLAANATTNVRPFVQMLRGLAIECSTAVVLSAHPSLTGIANNSGNSGSLDWGNAVRSRMFLRSAGSFAAAA